MARKTRRRNPTGPRISIDDALKTRRGKRIHFRDPRTKAALCGAGLPNKEFPFGSVVEVADLSGEVVLTCYRCIKLLAINKEMKKKPQIQSRRRKRNPVPVRTFSPTGTEQGSHYMGEKKLPGRRSQHVMVPGGRQGRYGSQRKMPRYDDWLEDSPWEPGPPEARTQPRYWGKRKPSREDLDFDRDMMSDRAYQRAEWNAYSRHGSRPGLRAKTTRRRRRAEEAAEREPVVDAYYKREKRKMAIPNPSNPYGFDVHSKFAELQAMPDSAFGSKKVKKTKKKRRR